MPKRPPKRPMSLDDLFRLREASDPRISPDGSTVAFVVTTPDRDADSNRSAIWSVPAKGGDPVQLTYGENDTTPRWAPDGRHLAFLRAEDGPAQVWLLPLAGGEARKITDLTGGASSVAWSPDSSRLTVTSRVDIDGEPDDDKEKERRKTAPLVIRSAAYKADGAGLLGSNRMHLFVVDVETGEAQTLTKNDISVSGSAWSPDGKTIAFAASLEDRGVTGRSRLFVVSPDGSEPDEIARWEGTAAAPVWSPDGKTILFGGAPDVSIGHTRLFTVPATGGKPKEQKTRLDRNVMFGAPAYPGATPIWTDDGILFSARDRGCTNVFSVGEGKAVRVVGDGDHAVSGLSRAKDRIAYVVGAPDIPADVFVASADGTKEHRLTNLNEELLDEVELHAPQHRTFTAPDGLDIHGWMTEGDGPKPQPLLVDIHGGPHNAWNGTFDAVHLYHEVLASQGWSILRLNPRGSDGYGEDFYRAVAGNWGEIDEDDFHSAIDTLVAEGLADRGAVAVCGYSYGGHMTNWLTARTDRFAAAVSGGCVSNLASFYGTSDIGFLFGRLEMGDDLHNARDRFTELSPITYVENVKTPTLILHGERDDRCPVSQAEEWFISLKRLGVTTEFVRYPGASHLFILLGKPSHRIDYNQRIVDWLTQHTGG